MRITRSTIHTVTVALLALLLPFAPACAQSLAERPFLTGDWYGLRSTLVAHGVALHATYTSDVVSNLSGGIDRRTVYLGNLDLTLVCQLHSLTGVPAGTIFVYGLADHGGHPSHHIGDVQGTDNIEAPEAIKLYEAWWQKMFFGNRLSLLVGLYDLSSEFDHVESAAAFLNSSFGVGPEFSNSGVNGPSIFPTTAFGGRLKAAPSEHVLLQAVALDGVAGDPTAPASTHIRLNADDGLLLAAEAALVWWDRTSAPGSPPPALQRLRRSRTGRSWGDVPYNLKLAAGIWGYTASQKDVFQTDGAGAQERVGHPGFYFLADWFAYREQASDRQGLSLFVQLGVADPDVDRFSNYTGAGMTYTGLIPGRDADTLGFAVAAARNGGPFRDASESQGLHATNFEVALEWTYRAVLTPWLAVQPDLQYVVHPGGRTDRSHALVLGLRLETSL